MSSVHHLAQANVGRGLGLVTDPVMKGFVDQLDYINSVADRSPGFVWRLQTEDGDATSVRLFDDPRIILNVSVWESVDALYDFAFRSDHLGPLRDRRLWFSKMERPHSVLWWIPAGRRPTLEDVAHRLDLLRDIGPTADAFTFSVLYDPTGVRIQRQEGLDRECGV